MITETRNRSNRVRRGKAFAAVTVSVALLAVAGFAAYKYLFNRPGEAAAMYIPADADMVITLDTNPSERQLATFKKITDALQKEGIAQKLDEMLKGSLEGKPIGEEIRPHLQRSFAMGMWMKDGGAEPDVVTLCAIDDPAAVKTLLEKHGQAGSGGVYAIPGTGDKMVGSVVDRYLALSNSPAILSRVASGTTDSIAKKAEFIEARAALPEDANLMVFISPRVFQTLGKTFGGSQDMSMMKGTQWMAYSATLVPEGIAFDYQCPMDTSKVPSLRTLGTMAPFDMDTLRSLPEGAYGVIGYSQAGKYWDSFEQAISETPAMEQEFEKGLSQFEQETGLSVENDIVPALQGEQVLAVYPGPSGKAEDLDMIVLITGSNGAQPAALASKLRALVERKSSEEGKAVRFSQSEVSGATVWEIDSQSRNEMVKGLGQTISPTQVYPAMPPQAALPPEAPPLDDSKPPITDFDYHYRPAPKQTEPPAFLKEKTIVYAEVNGGILITSSRSLLEKTLATKDSGRSLATEAAYTAMLDNLVPGSQGLMMINIKKIMQTLKPMMDKNLEGGPIQASDLAGLFGDGLVGLVVSGKYDGRVCTGRMLLPLDFERGIAMIGDGMRSGESMASAPQDEVETIR